MVRIGSNVDLDGWRLEEGKTDAHGQLVADRVYDLRDFDLSTWRASDRKAAIFQELEEQGVPVAQLRASVSADVDLFDLLCHVAYDRPPLTRRERASRGRKRDYFAKYGPAAPAACSKRSWISMPTRASKTWKTSACSGCCPSRGWARRWKSCASLAARVSSCRPCGNWKMSCTGRREYAVGRNRASGVGGRGVRRTFAPPTPHIWL